MFKVTPNPPATDTTSPYESLDSKKLHEAADRALDHYLGPADIMATTNEPESMFLANPAYDTESLLANASESLGSATTMLANTRAAKAPPTPGIAITSARPMSVPSARVPPEMM